MMTATIKIMSMNDDKDDEGRNHHHHHHHHHNNNNSNSNKNYNISNIVFFFNSRLRQRYHQGGEAVQEVEALEGKPEYYSVLEHLLKRGHRSDVSHI